MHPSIEAAAGILGVTADRVRLEIARAIRRAPDAGEVYAVIRGSRIVARRVPTGEWAVDVEPRRPVHEP